MRRKRVDSWQSFGKAFYTLHERVYRSLVKANGIVLAPLDMGGSPPSASSFDENLSERKETVLLLPSDLQCVFNMNESFTKDRKNRTNFTACKFPGRRFVITKRLGWAQLDA
jgi:hypothetical protein